MGLRPPFILSEYGSEQGVFPSLKALTDHVEAIDVRDGIYRIFDSTGRMAILHASARHLPPGRLGRDERWVEAATVEELADSLLELKPRTKRRGSTFGSGGSFGAGAGRRGDGSSLAARWILRPRPCASRVPPLSVQAGSGSRSDALPGRAASRSGRGRPRIRPGGPMRVRLPIVVVSRLFRRPVQPPASPNPGDRRAMPIPYR
jgi:hypothetical protein